MCRRRKGRWNSDDLSGKNVLFFFLPLFVTMPFSERNLSPQAPPGECVRLVRRLAGEIINHDFLLDLSLPCLSRTRPPSPSAISGGQTHCTKKTTTKNREVTASFSGPSISRVANVPTTFFGPRVTLLSGCRLYVRTVQYTDGKR